MLEDDVAGQTAGRRGGRLAHADLGIDQGENALRGRQPGLELAPEGRQIRHREPEAIDSGDEDVPRTDANRPGDGAAPAEVDQHGRADAGQGVEGREDVGHDEGSPDVDAVGLGVDLHELVVDGLLLPEVLGHADAADRLLDGLVDLAQGARTLPRHVAGQTAEEHGHGDDDRRHAQHRQRQPPVDAEQDEDQDKGRRQLVDDVGADVEHLAELLCVAGDAADDAAGGELVEEGQVLAHRGREGVVAHGVDHVGNDLGRQIAADAGQRPRADAGDEHQHGQHGREARPDLPGGQAVGDEDGHQRAQGGHQADGDDDDQHLAPVRPEVADDAGDEVAVAVGAVVLFGVDAAHEWGHSGLSLIGCVGRAGRRPVRRPARPSCSFRPEWG